MHTTDKMNKTTFPQNILELHITTNVPNFFKTNS